MAPAVHQAAEGLCRSHSRGVATPSQVICGSHVSGVVNDKSRDSPALMSRCSVRLVYEVISRFDDAKRRLVRDIGFQGLLGFPSLKQMNHKFSVWLMSRVDERSQRLVVDDRRNISFSREDVGIVFGIPCAGRLVVDRRNYRKEKRTALLKYLPGFDAKEQSSIKFVQQILDRNYGMVMSKDEEGSFQVAFVVFVMSCLFAPSAKHDHASVQYWDALAVPSEIKLYDWSSYVIQRLMDGVVKLRADLTRKIRAPNLTGCSLFLQVLYLDSMDLGQWNSSHCILPRVQFFSSDRIRYMVELDCSSDAHSTGEVSYGVSQLRNVSEVAYSWAAELRDLNGVRCSSDEGSLWEETVTMTRQLGIPIAAAAPVYLVLMEHRKKLDEASRKLIETSRGQEKALVRAVAGIVGPFISNYELHDHTSVSLLEGVSKDETEFTDGLPAGRSCHGCVICGNEHGGRVVKKVRLDMCEHSAASVCQARSYGGVGDYMAEAAGDDVTLRCQAGAADPAAMAAKAMARVYLLSRQCKASRCIDLNRSCTHHDPPAFRSMPTGVERALENA